MAKTTKAKTNGKEKEPKLIIEKDGTVFFKDATFKMVFKGSLKVPSSKYPGFLFQHKYLDKLKDFKKFVVLLETNGGVVRYVGMTRDEFMELGGEKIEIEGFEEVDAGQLKKKVGFFNRK